MAAIVKPGEGTSKSRYQKAVSTGECAIGGRTMPETCPSPDNKLTRRRAADE